MSSRPKAQTESPRRPYMSSAWQPLPDTTLRLNLGCGPIQPHGWVNMDGSNRARFAHHLPPLDRLLVRLGWLPPTAFGPQTTISNLKGRLPFADGAAGAVYAGELWEHFEYPDAVRATHECFRVLAPGGVLRLCVPDGVAFWQRYLELHAHEMTKPQALRDPAPVRRHIALYFDDICTRPPGLRSLGHKHKWQFDEVQLIALLEEAGFVSVARMPFQQSRIADIAAVERSDFLIVEGIRPIHA